MKRRSTLSSCMFIVYWYHAGLMLRGQTASSSVDVSFVLDVVHAQTVRWYVTPGRRDQVAAKTDASISVLGPLGWKAEHSGPASMYQYPRLLTFDQL